MSQWCNTCGEILTPENAYVYEMLSGKKQIKKEYMSNQCRPCRKKEMKIRYNLEKLHPRPPSGSKCDLCGRFDKLHLDHEHGEEHFRGFCCKNCNIGLGHLGDSEEGLEKALKYLKKANGRRGNKAVENAVGEQCVPECHPSVQVSAEAWIECESQGCGIVVEGPGIDLPPPAAEGTLQCFGNL
jgi:hypothetical protein